ncbi:hypothetical protein KC19_VG135700 [Ceratodon purpureus]|uniref:Secreted protein n=1 Tax=Ceratodon purpureus TaxID=3225 RepID=A0A8T0HQ16_CERPU|nr:hypothetical protein KC19_VG135700 [Ceratodon purpureus]
MCWCLRWLMSGALSPASHTMHPAVADCPRQPCRDHCLQLHLPEDSASDTLSTSQVCTIGKLLTIHAQLLLEDSVFLMVYLACSDYVSHGTPKFIRF